MVAAAALRYLDPFGTGKIVLFQVTYDRDWHWFELIFFVIIGIFCGLWGACFTRLNVIWSTKVRSRSWMARHVSALLCLHGCASSGTHLTACFIYLASVRGDHDNYYQVSRPYALNAK
jgi:H+/Cl- antiporter ClcA